MPGRLCARSWRYRDEHPTTLAHLTHRPDTPPAGDETLALALQRLARPADESGVWPALQPRVARPAAAGTSRGRWARSRVIGMVGLAAWQGSRLADADRTAEVTVVTHPAAPDGGRDRRRRSPAPPAASMLPTDTTDPRVDVIRRFVNGPVRR